MTLRVLEYPNGPASTFEALVYEMPLGMRYRKAVLWHGSQQYVFRDLRERRRDPEHLQWEFNCSRRGGEDLEVVIGGNSRSIHHLPYVKTDCSCSFEVTNNSLAAARLVFKRKGNPSEEMSADVGAVLEMAGP